jgi:hypothetical protein
MHSATNAWLDLHLVLIQNSLSLSLTLASQGLEQHMRCSRGLQCVYKGGRGKFQGNVSGGLLAPLPLLEFPPDLQRRILGLLPLREMAQLACLNKDLRAVHLDRVKQRDAVVAGLLESHCRPEFREGLLCLQTALPQDFIFDPPVRPLALCPLLHCVVYSMRATLGGHSWQCGQSSTRNPVTMPQMSLLHGHS